VNCLPLRKLGVHSAQFCADYIDGRDWLSRMARHPQLEDAAVARLCRARDGVRVQLHAPVETRASDGAKFIAQGLAARCGYLDAATGLADGLSGRFLCAPVCRQFGDLRPAPRASSPGATPRKSACAGRSRGLLALAGVSGMPAHQRIPARPLERFFGGASYLRAPDGDLRDRRLGMHPGSSRKPRTH
jgi:hypothetical protein